MRTTKGLSLLAVFLLHCSDPAPPPSCTVECDGGGADGSAPDGETSDAGSPDGSGTCTVDCDAGNADGGIGYDAKSYEVVGRFDWARRLLIATERVTLSTASNPGFIELDAAVDVKSVQGESGASLPFVVAPNSLRIDVSSLHTSEDTLSFTIDYEAPTSEGLVASVSRDDDPVTSRVFYTDSEPLYGTLWLPAIHKPSDRAEFKVELTVGANEDVVANGARIKDEMRDGQRVVRYEMTNPIPTYTMAFAGGELEHRERTTGRVPLSVWYRRGLLLEPNDMLDFLTEAMATLESLVGPYPWPSYAVVLLPEFSGGMENTTITFTTETSGQANVGRSLQAHELGHQWFGDWVTVATFDDVWIKEGMATLLAPEVDRARRDAENKGRRFGSSFNFRGADSIRDRSLVGIAKYTSGPYQRAAWLLTQIRDRVGEAAFWQALRQVLTRYALGSIDSESFVRSFGLDEPTVQKILRLLDEKRTPAVAIATSVEGAATQVTLSLTDPGATLIAPVTVTVVDAAGQATSSTLVSDAPLTISVPSGGYLAPDETEVHPDWRASFTTSAEEYAKIVPLFFPASSAARAVFSARSAAHQERAIDQTIGSVGKLDVTPSAFAAFYGELDSVVARRSAGLAGCNALKMPGDSAWSEVLGPILSNPAITTAATGYAACGTEFASRTFGAEFASLAARVDGAGASRFVYLSSFDYGARMTLDTLSPLAIQGGSLQLREQALGRLGSQVTNASYTPVSQDEAPRYRDFFRARLADAKSANRFQTVWRAVVALRDDRALTVAAAKLHTVALSDNVQRGVVCDAYTIAQAVRPEAWSEFQQAAQPWESLGAAARAALIGSGCSP
jgi:aminopeptidase N